MCACVLTMAFTMSRWRPIRSRMRVTSSPGSTTSASIIGDPATREALVVDPGDDRAIALQHPYGDGDVNQALSNGTECAPAVAHRRKYIIGGEAGCHGDRCAEPL